MKKEPLHIKLGDKLVITKGFEACTANLTGETSFDPKFISTLNRIGSIVEYIGSRREGNWTNFYFKNHTNGEIFYLGDIDPRIKKMKPYTEGDEIPTHQALGYKIRYNGQWFKPKKYTDLGKVKSALLIAFGYYNKLHSYANQQKHPELMASELPYWFQGGEDIKLDEFKNVEIVGVNGKVQIPVDFNAYEYIRESNVRLTAICEYGIVVKEMFTKLKDDKEYTYFLTYTSDEYNTLKNSPNLGYYEYERFNDMKESDVIKDALKQLKVSSKDYKKVSKYGKTAVAFKNESDLFGLVKLLPAENVEFFVVTQTEVRQYDKEIKRKLAIRDFIENGE
jgi:hypothetical protein